MLTRPQITIIMKQAKQCMRGILRQLEAMNLRASWGQTPRWIVDFFSYCCWIDAGWWYTYSSEKYESQLGWLFPIYRKIKNVPNHQSVLETSRNIPQNHPNNNLLHQPVADFPSSFQPSPSQTRQICSKSFPGPAEVRRLSPLWA